MAKQPKDFELENTSVWAFPTRGSWATHSGNYRGNWAPQIPRNIILRYSEPGDIVLDQMVGSGTTLVECVLTGRNGVGIDISSKAIEITRNNLEFDKDEKRKVKIKTGIADARNLKFLKDNTIDLAVMHPPYANMIRYKKGEIKGDLSDISSIEKFCKEMGKVAKESYRVLKPDKYCAILIGDTRRKQHYVPLAFRVMREFLKAGFILKEDVIKEQFNCKGTGMWTGSAKKYNFLLIMHEHLFVFRKPRDQIEKELYKESSIN